MKKLSSDDRSVLIRLASSLPKGSGERKAILAGLKSASDPEVEKFWADYGRVTDAAYEFRGKLLEPALRFMENHVHRNSSLHGAKDRLNWRKRDIKSLFEEADFYANRAENPPPKAQEFFELVKAGKGLLGAEYGAMRNWSPRADGGKAEKKARWAEKLVQRLLSKYGGTFRTASSKRVVADRFWEVEEWFDIPQGVEVGGKTYRYGHLVLQWNSTYLELWEDDRQKGAPRFVEERADWEDEAEAQEAADFYMSELKRGKMPRVFRYI